MHIVIISACEKRAIKKTRAVLDSYAIRTGEMSWASPITTEGMREMRAALKRCATRQTAVACYRNEGRRSMKLLWIVGSKRPFGDDGHFPCGTMRVKKDKEELPHWVRLAALLARASGLAHDTGKAGTIFQEKLTRALQNSFSKVADPVRHEWLSMRLIQEMRTGTTMQQAWEKLKSPKCLQELSLKKGLGGAFDVLDILVVFITGCSMALQFPPFAAMFVMNALKLFQRGCSPPDGMRHTRRPSHASKKWLKNIQPHTGGVLRSEGLRGRS